MICIWGEKSPVCMAYRHPAGSLDLRIEMHLRHLGVPVPRTAQPVTVDAQVALPPGISLAIAETKSFVLTGYVRGAPGCGGGLWGRHAPAAPCFCVTNPGEDVYVSDGEGVQAASPQGRSSTPRKGVVGHRFWLCFHHVLRVSRQMIAASSRTFQSHVLHGGVCVLPAAPAPGPRAVMRWPTHLPTRRSIPPPAAASSPFSTPVWRFDAIFCVHNLCVACVWRHRGRLWTPKPTVW